MNTTKKLLSIALALSIISMFAFAFAGVTETDFIGNASAGSTMSENITETVEEYIPLVVALTFIGIALAGLGINMRRNQ